MHEVAKVQGGDALSCIMSAGHEGSAADTLKMGIARRCFKQRKSGEIGHVGAISPLFVALPADWQEMFHQTAAGAFCCGALPWLAWRAKIVRISSSE